MTSRSVLVDAKRQRKSGCTLTLFANPRSARRPVSAEEVFGHTEFVTDGGDLRTLPPQLPDADPRWAGLDGFYAARLIRKAA